MCVQSQVWQSNMILDHRCFLTYANIKITLKIDQLTGKMRIMPLRILNELNQSIQVQLSSTKCQYNSGIAQFHYHGGMVMYLIQGDNWWGEVYPPYVALMGHAILQ